MAHATSFGLCLLLFTVAHAQQQQGEVFLIDRTDCEALVSWPAFAALPGAPASCQQVPCNTVPGATCDYKTGRLLRLDMSSRGLSGALPERWGTLAGLVELSLKGNSLTGTVPASWQGLTSLMYLDLSDNQLTGPLPQAWSTRKFTLLNLTGTQLVNAGAQAPQPDAAKPTSASTPGAANTTASSRDCGPGSPGGPCQQQQERKHSNIESAAAIAALAAAAGVAVALTCAVVALWRWHSRRKARQQAKQGQLPVFQAQVVASSHAGIKAAAHAPPTKSAQVTVKV